MESVLMDVDNADSALQRSEKILSRSRIPSAFPALRSDDLAEEICPLSHLMIVINTSLHVGKILAR